MVLLGIALGFSAFCFFGALIGEVILKNPGEGIFPGLVIGLWAALPAIHSAILERTLFLHPQPREYELPAKVVFATIRDFLAEVSYNYGDKWRVVTADTQAGRIRANLSFTDEVVQVNADARGQINTRKERLHRFIDLAVTVTDTGRGTTSLKIDFDSKADGANLFACDSIISSCQKAISMRLGEGKSEGNIQTTKLPAPPWWLLALSALSLIGFYSNIMKG